MVPQFLDLTEPVRIWAGYGKSPELFAANGRPKRVHVTVLRRISPQEIKEQISRKRLETPDHQ